MVVGMGAPLFILYFPFALISYLFLDASIRPSMSVYVCALRKNHQKRRVQYARRIILPARACCPHFLFAFHLYFYLRFTHWMLSRYLDLAAKWFPGNQGQKSRGTSLLFNRCTMVENRKKHRKNSHPIIYCPTSEGVSKASERANKRMSERTSEWPSTYICVFLYFWPVTSYKHIKTEFSIGDLVKQPNVVFWFFCKLRLNENWFFHETYSNEVFASHLEKCHQTDEVFRFFLLTRFKQTRPNTWLPLSRVVGQGQY